jgi:hypothetical protein
MPTELEHIDKWKHNRAFLAHIPEHFSDWRATVSFYAALHAVEAFFWAKFKRDCYDHEQRDPVIQQHLPSVYPDYFQLYNASRVARYMISRSAKAPIFTTFMPAGKVVNVLIKQRLQRLEQHIIRELALDPDEFPELYPEKA